MKVRAGALGATLVALAVSFVPMASSSSSTGAAMYTAAQASAGAKAYAKDCSSCHGAKLEGVSAPALRGGASGLKGFTVATGFTFVSTQMPAGNPGALSSAEYVNIVAYILSRNGHPAGSVALTAAAAKKSKVQF